MKDFNKQPIVVATPVVDNESEKEVPFNADEQVPFNWNIEENDGEQMVATCSVTGRRFVGKTSTFKRLLRA